MPDMTGVQFYEALLETRPDDARRVVFMTGGALSTKMLDFLASTPNQRIEKPFEVEGMKTLIQEFLPR